MATIEERVVGMRFDSSKFKSGIQPAIDGLDKLKSSLKLEGATKAIDELDSAGKKFSLANVGDAAQGVSLKFVALATVGITALTNITNKAMAAGERIMKSLTIDPIKAGFDEYELKMGSIQTILANTARYNTGLPDVTAALDELNNYADKTIYNFGAMTKNIGLFTNAGIRLEDATSMIKGFSNAAASSGTTAEGAAHAAGQLSQALNSGLIRAQDWVSLTNVGMGNKNMQDGLYDIAVAMGKVEAGTDDAIAIQTNFKGSLENNWLETDIMSSYLRIMAGDMDDAGMAALGLSADQITSFNKQQDMAEDSATKVRTYTQLLGTMQEAVGSGWSESFQIIVGDFNQATDLFTAVNNKFGGLIGGMSKARNDLLNGWVAAGGRTAAIDAITKAFQLLEIFINPVILAFKEIFPPATGEQLANITKGINNFIQGITLGTREFVGIKDTARGFFALLDIGRMIVVGFFKMLGDVLGFASQGTGGFLTFTGSIGNFIVKVRDAIKSGEGISQFFGVFGTVLKTVLGLFAGVIGFFADFASSAGEMASGGFDGFLGKVEARFSALVGFFRSVTNLMSWFGEIIASVGRTFEPLLSRIGDLATGLGEAIKNSFSTGNFSAILDFINTGLLATIGVMVWKFVTKIKDMFTKVKPEGGLKDAIKGVFGELGNTLSALQAQVKAKALMLIAGAVGILTLSVIALSLIDPAKLAVALGAITVMFAQLGVAMKAFDAMFTLKAAAKMAILSVGMIGMGVAMIFFAGALAILAAIPFTSLVKGVLALGAIMALVVPAMLALSFAGPGAILGSAALVIAAAGIVILAGALKLLGMLSWDEIARGLVAMGASLLILAGGLTLMAGSIPGAIALVIAAAGLTILAGALMLFGMLSWDEIGRGLAAIGGMLLILAFGLTAMMLALPGAAALVVASVGLAAMAGVLLILAKLDWETLKIGLAALGGLLLILAFGLTAMIFALPGAAALVVAAGALAILAPVLLLLGTMSWETIGIGLTALAGALVVLAIGGVALIPALPGLIGLGLAVLLLGTGVLAAGIGVTALAVGLGILAVAGGAAISVLVMAITEIAKLIPFVATQIGLGLIEIINIIGSNGPAIITAITTVLLALIAAIVAVIPAAVEAIVTLVTSLVEALIVLIPLLVDGGMRLVIGILDGIARNVGKVVEKGVDVIVAFMDGIGKAIPRLLVAGADLIIKFVNGIATTIRTKSGELQDAGINVAKAIVDGMVGGIGKGITAVVTAAKDLAKKALNAAKDFLGIKSPSREFKKVGKFSAEGLAGGLIEFSSISEKAATRMGSNTLMAIKKSMVDAGNVMSLSMDNSPTIRPVLDLSGIKKDAGLISGLVGSQSLTVDSATSKANDISAKYGEYQRILSESGRPTTEVNLVQNNYSPKPLPATEIYRNSKNQMSILKGELEKSA